MISEINEMLEYINESYHEFLSAGRGQRYAIARLFDEYDVFEDDSSSIVEDMITMLAIGELLAGNDGIYIGNRERVQKTFGKIDVFIGEVKDKIKESELDELIFRIKKVDEALAKAKITEDPFGEKN